ncbi:Ribosome biogenesis protein NSA2-like protein [Acropora cervicornis]|uniref:Ribosome biogenesis protein NSA2 homolog n=1 Tax=Acropora cervicornis TaxID=6130 RepID=A0AAD9V6D1_ACRCE|nr:Ribosome biogenesis protein NSA2-like protein [Acropora cervicornis]
MRLIITALSHGKVFSAWPTEGNDKGSLKDLTGDLTRYQFLTAMPQNEYVERSRKHRGYRFDHFEKKRKKEGREPHTLAKNAHKFHGLRAKLYNRKRHREGQSRAKVLSNMIKQKRKEKAGKWDVPLPKVKAVGEDEVFKGLRFKKAHVTHPELKATFCLPIIGVKKNPQSPMYTQLGVITKGTVVEVNVSELGLVTQGGKVVWGKYAQVTNHPENDGCINAVLLV